MSSSLYRLEKLKHQYDGRQILSIDHLEIMRGEILAIVGPSGAGKSSLLRLLNFLEMPAAGHIIFDDHPITPSLPLATRRRVTTVFQQSALLNRSVTANINYGLKIRGQKLGEQELNKWLEQLGLTELAAKKAATLSSGEAQRVSLARALVTRPDVLLLDEPTANLDPYNVGLIEEIIQENNSEQGTTIVLVTHNIFQAKRLAKRTALLLQGELIENAGTAAFFDSPQDPRTAAFLRGELVY